MLAGVTEPTPSARRPTRFPALRDASDRARAGASRVKELAYAYLPSGAAGFLGYGSKGPRDEHE